jgi:hypothetical protein
MIWVVVYLTCYLQMALFAATGFGLAQLLGAEVRAVQIGAPRLFRLKLGTTVLSVGALPITSYIEPSGRADSDGDWWRLPAARRFVITLGPFAAYAVVAVVFLGPARAATSIAHGFYQVFAQWDTAPLVRGFLALTPLSVVVGVLFSKIFVANATTVAGGLAHELRAGARLFAIVYFLSGLWISGRFAVGAWHALF